MYNLGAKIAELRKKQSLTQTELAELLNVSAQAVSKWEIGASYPDIALVPQIAKLLHCSTDYLLLEDAAPETKYENLAASQKDKKDLIFKIRVLDGKTKVNLNLPVAFFKLGIQLSKSMEIQGKDITENLKNIDFDALIAMAEQGVLGKLLEVETEDGQTVEIWVE